MYLECGFRPEDLWREAFSPELNRIITGFYMCMLPKFSVTWPQVTPVYPCSLIQPTRGIWCWSLPYILIIVPDCLHSWIFTLKCEDVTKNLQDSQDLKPSQQVPWPMPAQQATKRAYFLHIICCPQSQLCPLIHSFAFCSFQILVVNHSSKIRCSQADALRDSERKEGCSHNVSYSTLL